MNLAQPRSGIAIPVGASIYLDLLRGLAAVGVLLSHAGQSFFSGGFWWTPPIGHQMVVVFFVLSGFVMSHAIGKVGPDWRRYVCARFSRIESVAVPALLLTIICDTIGRSINPDFYAVAAREDGYGVRMMLSAVYLQQSWNFAASPGSNVPFWSLAYEVWYYVLLGLWIFIRNSWARITACIIAGVVAGPKILLLLPVWLLGLLAHRLCGKLRWKKGWAATVFLSSLIVLGLLCLGVITPFGAEPEWQATAPLFFSSGFVGDYQIGVVMALNIVAAYQFFQSDAAAAAVKRLKKPVSFAANRSFSLYAFHMPLLYLASVAIPYSKGNQLEVFGVLALLLLLVFALHHYTENKRGVWEKLMESCLAPAGTRDRC